MVGKHRHPLKTLLAQIDKLRHGGNFFVGDVPITRNSKATTGMLSTQNMGGMVITAEDLRAMQAGDFILRLQRQVEAGACAKDQDAS